MSDEIENEVSPEWVHFGRDGQMVITEIIQDYAHLLNPRAAEIFHSKKSCYTLHQCIENGERAIYPCMYASAIAEGEHNIQVAAEYLINEINKIDDRGELRAVLAPLGTIELHNGQSKIKKFVVFSFFFRVVSDHDCRNPQNLGPMYTNEGGISQVVFKD